MRFCRFVDKDGTHYGLVENKNGQDVITALMGGPHLELSDSGMPGSVVLPDPASAKPLPSPIPLESAMLLIPFPLVTKIVCLGRNYAEHAKELGNPVPVEPLLFFKPPSSMLAPGGKILRPKLSNRVDHEAELAIIIGRTCHKLRPEEDVRPDLLRRHPRSQRSSGQSVDI